MPRKKPVARVDTISKLEAKILEMLDDVTLTVGERIQLINAGTRLATARHKISGDDEEGAFWNKGK